MKKSTFLETIAYIGNFPGKMQFRCKKRYHNPSQSTVIALT